jgi:hypothetical protein
MFGLLRYQHQTDTREGFRGSKHAADCQNTSRPVKMHKRLLWRRAACWVCGSGSADAFAEACSARVQLGTKIVATRYNSVLRSSKRFCQRSLTRWQSLKLQRSEMSSEHPHMLRGDLQTAAERTNNEWSNKPRTIHS